MRTLLPVALLAALTTLAATKPVEPAHTPVPLISPVQDKNFYLLSLMERTPAVRAAVKADPALAGIGKVRLEALDSAVKSCAIDIACYLQAIEWTPEQAAEASRALAALYKASPAVRAMVDGPLRESGMYVRYNSLDGAAFLERAWSDCVLGVNFAIDVYGAGKPPRYAAIDSITYDPKSQLFPRVVENLALALEDDRASLELFFAPALRFAVDLMVINDRDEAGRVEPMERTENAAAFRRAKTVVWSKYKYSAIVVPGAGNDRPGMRLSGPGKLRDEIAAKRFKDGQAPFLIVSGGFVHPAHTEFAEALEMKRDLMARFGIPASAIIVDPHARHTTTNMRNAARLIYRYGMPFSKHALVTTDTYQSKSIESPAFAKRCTDELGYVPYKLLGRTTPFDLEFLPLIESLHANPLEPLDP